MRELSYYTDFEATASNNKFIPTVFTSSMSEASDKYTLYINFKKKTLVSKIVLTGGYIPGGGSMSSYTVTTGDGQKDSKTSLYAEYGNYTITLPNGGFVCKSLTLNVAGYTTNGYYTSYRVRIHGEVAQKAIIDIDGNKYGLSGSQLLQLPETSDERTLYNKGFEIQSVSASSVISSISKVSNKFKLNVIEK